MLGQNLNAGQQGYVDALGRLRPKPPAATPLEVIAGPKVPSPDVVKTKLQQALDEQNRLRNAPAESYTEAVSKMLFPTGTVPSPAVEQFLGEPVPGGTFLENLDQTYKDVDKAVLGGMFDSSVVPNAREALGVAVQNVLTGDGTFLPEDAAAKVTSTLPFVGDGGRYLASQPTGGPLPQTPITQTPPPAGAPNPEAVVRVASGGQTPLPVGPTQAEAIASLASNVGAGQQQQTPTPQSTDWRELLDEYRALAPQRTADQPSFMRELFNIAAQYGKDDYKSLAQQERESDREHQEALRQHNIAILDVIRGRLSDKEKREFDKEQNRLNRQNQITVAKAGRDTSGADLIRALTFGAKQDERRAEVLEPEIKGLRSAWETWQDNLVPDWQDKTGLGTTPAEAKAEFDKKLNEINAKLRRAGLNPISVVNAQQGLFY